MYRGESTPYGLKQLVAGRRSSSSSSAPTRAASPRPSCAHREKLAEYEAIRDGTPDEVPDGPRQALAMGVRHEREFVRFWEELAG